MKKTLLTFLTFLLIGFTAIAQCPDDGFFNLGQDVELDHMYYDEATNLTYAVGYFTDVITVAGQYEFSPLNTGETGKFILEMDTLGQILRTWQMEPDFNYLEGGANQLGYFSPGLAVTATAIYVPNVYQDNGRYVFQIEAYNKSSGGLLWTKEMIGSVSAGTSLGFDAIEEDSNGNIILTGVFADTLTIEGTEYINTDTNTGFVMSIEPNENTLNYFVPIHSSNNMELFGLQTDNNGGVYVSGNSLGNNTITIGSETFNYTGLNSGFVFKLSGENLDWINFFESDTGVEPHSLLYDQENDYIHYSAVDYPNPGEDIDPESEENVDLAVDTRIGAFNATDGAIAWEREMAVPGYFHLSYSGWLAPNQGAIYYPTVVTSNGRNLSKIYMDGSLLQDSISSVVVLHKFDLQGNSQLVSPTRYSFIGDVAVLPSGRVMAQTNYTGFDVSEETFGYLNSINSPAGFGYFENKGGSLVSNAEFVASSSDPDATYQWLFSNEPIAGATDPVLFPDSPGEYSVDIIDSKGCIFSMGPYTITGTAPSSEQDSLALVSLYNTAGGANWVDNTNWTTGDLSTWQGVTLNGEGRVLGLELSGNNLAGDVPTDLANLDALEKLYIDNNTNLSGDLISLMEQLPQLQEINVSMCAFTGEISGAIFQTNLRLFFAPNNQITGVIPPEIANAANLTSLDLSGNKLEGTIPAEITGLTSLSDLSLANNGLEGTIPAEIGSLTNLTVFNVSNNKLTGEIPQSITNSTGLTAFFASQNNLSGTLPDVLHLSSFTELNVWGNPQLMVEIPDDLDQLTGLIQFGIGGTKQQNIPFPTDVYQLVNLFHLDMGGLGLTGTISNDIANLTNLETLYLWQNDLEGDFPAEVTSIPNLRILDISQNSFTSIPDFSGKELTELYVAGNMLTFSSLVPNLSIPNFVFRYQSRIGGDEDRLLALGASTTLNSPIPDFENTTYVWIFNNDTIAQNELNLSVSDFDLSKAGSYGLRMSHSEIPDFYLQSGFVNLKPEGEPRRWYVDNREGKVADFNSFYQAIYASRANDTLYVAGSPEAYDSPGGLLLTTPRIIYGPGYFLEENVGNQFNTDPAVIADVLNIRGEAHGTEVYGLSFASAVRLNNSYFLDADTLRDIKIIGNRFLEGSDFGFISHIDGLTFKGNVNPIFGFYITDTQGAETGLYGAYNNFDVSNNINIRIRPFSYAFETSSEQNQMENIVFSYNIIDTIANIRDAVFENNIIKTHEATGNTFTNTIEYQESLFENASGTLTVDSDYRTSDAGLDAGVFAGVSPYVESGLPPIPSIYGIQISATLTAEVSAKGGNINRMRYLYNQTGVTSRVFALEGFDVANDVSVEFLPNRSYLVPGETYELLAVAIDDTGLRSHRTYIPYTATTASLSGSVLDTDARAVNNGDIKVFAINRFANKYDTASVTALNESNVFEISDLILGEYIIMADPDSSVYPDLIPTYLGNAIDWELADTLVLQADQSDILIEVEKQPEDGDIGNAILGGIVEEEYDDPNSNLRSMMPRRGLRGSGVSMRKRVGSTRETSLRLLEDDYELVAYLKTDENARFEFPDLPAGEYRIRVEYPGVVVDETSDIDFNLTGDQGEEVQVAALVEDGKVTVTEVSRTANKDAEISLFKFYPNPANNELTIMVENISGFDKVIIADLNGKIHVTNKLMEGENKIDISAMKSGMYLVRLEDNEGNYLVSKLIKE